ncbi:MAG: polyprenyl synthetase family protein [Anaerolineales bacterium]|jgi:geranylgeranyl pyrophosphate synthase
MKSVKSKFDDNYAEYASAVVGYIESSHLLRQWPDCREVLIAMLSEEEPWLLALPIVSCRAVGGVTTEAIPVAATWAALHSAAVILDTVQDNEDVLRVGLDDTASALSIAVGQIFLAFSFVNDVKNNKVFTRTAKMFPELCFFASEGQYLGLAQNYYDHEIDDAMELYWRQVILKSGNTIRAATTGGAVVGTNSEPLITALGDYGTYLGAILQILDDCSDVLTSSNGLFEISLPFLLRSLAASDDQMTELRNLTTYGTSSRDLLGMLDGYDVPGKIADILMELQRRALKSLELLDESDAKLALENIAKSVLETSEE